METMEKFSVLVELWFPANNGDLHNVVICYITKDPILDLL